PRRKASRRCSCPASRSGAMRTNGADPAFPTAPTRLQPCRRRPPKPTSHRSAYRSSRSAGERSAWCKTTLGPSIVCRRGDLVRGRRWAGRRQAMPRLHATLLTIAGLVLALTTAAAAQEYPTKPVRLIIPFPPGGSNDVVGRLIATHLGDRLGKQVVVDNRGAGAGGVVGSEGGAHSPPDG